MQSGLTPEGKRIALSNVTHSWRWLESTRRLQEEAFDVKFPLTRDQLADYVTYNMAALTAELGEFAQEVQWKPWAQPRGNVNRAAAVKELIDVGHFLANLAVALGVTDEEWERLYRAKQELNRQRQVSGYDSKSTKCPSCKRALDDVGFTTFTELKDPEVKALCNACGGALTQAHIDAVFKQLSDRCPSCGAVYGEGETRCMRDGSGELVDAPMPWCADIADFV